MDETELAGLEPVTDPSLIAMLEQPQSAINKTEGENAPAYSQSALDAFDRAIDSANRLKAHRGYGAAVGSAFDPQSWTSFNPLTGEPYSATPARDFMSELEAMKAQVFLPMVQSMKGMGALSNAEGQKLTDAIGALDPRMSESAFSASLDRIVADLTKYRDRGMARRGGAAPAEAQQRAAAIGPGDIGFNTPDQPENPLTPEQQRAYDAWHQANPNATAEQLVAFVGTMAGANGQPLAMPLDRAQAIVEARDAGAGVKGGAEAVSGLTPEQQAQVDQRLSQTDGAGSAVVGAADTVTLGHLDELGAGVDAFTGAMSGEGSFSDLYRSNRDVNRAYMDELQSRDPWWYTGGQIAGGLVLPTFAARTPAQLARVGAGYGAAYGAGSAEDVSDIPLSAATGGTIGAATAWGGGKLLDKLTRGRIPPPKGADAAEAAKETAASRYARAQQFDINPSIGDVRGMGAKVLERGLDVSPGSSGVMNEARERLGQEVVRAADQVSGTFGPVTTFPEMGAAVQRGLRAWNDKFERVASKAYDAVPISDKAPTTLTNTVQQLREMTTIFESNPKMAAIFSNLKLNRYMEALTPEVVEVERTGPRAGLERFLGAPAPTENVGGTLSWKDLKTFRSRIGEEIGEARFSDSPLKSELRRLYGALSEDMRASAAAQGPDALRKFQRANDLYRAGQERIDKALKFILGDDGALTAEKAASRIQAMVKSGKASSDLDRIAQIRRSLPNEEASEVISGIIRLLGQPMNSEGRDFAAETFIRNFKDMSPAAKNLLFGGETKALRQNLEEFAKVMDNLAANKSTRNTSWTAPALLGATAFSLGNLPAVLAHAATSYGAAKLWTNPKFVRWATGYTKMMRGAAKGGKPNADAVKTQAKLLRKLASSEPAIAQEIAPLHDMLISAANDNVASVAAESGTQQQQRAQ